eukprot:jgi/Picre1/32313/NNA_007659.t1
MVLLQSFVPDAAGSPKKSPFLEKANSGGKSQPPALDDDSHRSSAFLHLNFLIKQQKLLAEEIERIKAQVHGSNVVKKNSDDDESLKKTKVFRDDTASL